MAAITIEELNTLCEDLLKARAEEQAAKNVKDSIGEMVEEIEKKIIHALTESNLTSFKSPFGQAVLKYRTSVRTPKTPEARAAFFDYLKSKGLFDEMIGVNSASLNKFYREEFDEAVSRGESDFSIPGLDAPTVEPTLSFCK